VNKAPTSVGLPKRGHVGSRDPLLEFWDPSIPETIEARNFNFGIELDDNLY